MTTSPTDWQTLADEVSSEHQALRSLLEAATGAAPPDDARAPLRALDSFVVGMCEHLGAEAEVLHPAARKLLPDGTSAVAASAPCHQTLQRQMRVLEQHLWGDARSAPAEMAPLREDVEATFAEHVRHDEALASRVDEALDPDERRSKVDQLRRATMQAPTRPHPHAPQRGPLARPVRWLAGRWDDVLDTVDVRSTAGRRRARAPQPLSLWGGYVVGHSPASRDERRLPPV
jgi:hypothetical protein